MKKYIRMLTVLLSIMAVKSGANAGNILMTPDQPMSMDALEITPEEEEVRRQHKENGYYSTYSEYAVNLLAFKDKKGTAESMLESDPWFKILRLNIIDFSLSFPFDGLPSIGENDLLGFVPGGGYDNAGKWTGLGAYFTHTDFGVCSLTIFDMLLIDKQSIYDSNHTAVNTQKKTTWTSASGSPESGFVYQTSWTGKRYMKTLECANKKPFDKQVLEDIVAYAKKIDKDLLDAP